MPLNNKYKRDLLNVAGTAHKWIFGLMDDDDRQNIIQKLDVGNSNNHNIVQTVISIRAYF